MLTSLMLDVTFGRYLVSKDLVGKLTTLLNPPSLAGNASRFGTESFGDGQPVMDGIKSERMVSSRLCR